MSEPNWIRTIIKGDYATIIMEREPVNSMNLPFWIQLSKALNDLEDNRGIRGVIFKSGVKKKCFYCGT